MSSVRTVTIERFDLRLTCILANTLDSYWYNSLYFSYGKQLNMPAAGKLETCLESAPAQQTSIHPFILLTDYHTHCFLTLSLWSSDCVCVCVFPSLYPTKEQWWKPHWVNLCIWSLLMVLPPLTQSHCPTWEHCHCTSVEQLVDHSHILVYKWIQHG